MDKNRDQTPTHDLIKLIAELLEKGSVAVVITVVAGLETVGSKLLVDEDGKTFGSLGNAELDSLVSLYALRFIKSRDETRMISVKEFAPEFVSTADARLLFERLQPPLRLVICGAGHVGAALANLGSFVGYHTTLIDDRPEFVRRSRFADEKIDLVVAEKWDEAVQRAIGNGKGVAVAVVTRGHNEDEECMRAVVAKAPDYVGLIGSKRRTNIVIENLRRAGASEDQLRNIRAPIGLDIGAVSPEEVALAIIAEIVAERHRASGGSLSTWRRK